MWAMLRSLSLVFLSRLERAVSVPFCSDWPGNGHQPVPRTVPVWGLRVPRHPALLPAWMAALRAGAQQPLRAQCSAPQNADRHLRSKLAFRFGSRVLGCWGMSHETLVGPAREGGSGGRGGGGGRGREGGGGAGAFEDTQCSAQVAGSLCGLLPTVSEAPCPPPHPHPRWAPTPRNYSGWWRTLWTSLASA